MSTNLTSLYKIPPRSEVKRIVVELESYGK